VVDACVEVVDEKGVTDDAFVVEEEFNKFEFGDL
jgi:hypothetical protein